jgi:hypothetical protein
MMLVDAHITETQNQTVNCEQCLLGKNLREKLRKEMEDIKSDNTTQ